MKKIHLNEHGYHVITEAMKEGFDYNMLRNMSFAKKVRYCKDMLGFPIGNGSSRMVFQIDDEKCLKLAKNTKGIAQNEQESTVLTDYYKADYSIFPKMYENLSDMDNFQWIVSEYVLPARAKDFKVATGYDWKTVKMFIATVCARYDRMSRQLIDDDTMEQIMEYDEENSGFFHELEDYLCNYQMPVGDYLRLANWGMTKRYGEPYMVILDDGLTNEIFNKYYVGH